MPNIKPRAAEVVIYQGDDLAHLAELRQAAETAQRIVDRHRTAVEDGNARFGDAPSAEAEKAAYDEFVAEAAERALTVEVRAIGRRRFRDLLEEHPPRKVKVKRTEDGREREVEEDHPDDASYGVNLVTFSEALLTYVDDGVRTITAPEFGSRKAVQAFLDDDLSEGDFDTLFMTAYFLNRGSSGDPKGTVYNSTPKSNATST